MRYETEAQWGEGRAEGIEVPEWFTGGPKEFPMGFDLRMSKVDEPWFCPRCQTWHHDNTCGSHCYRGSQGTCSGALTRAPARGSPMPPGAARWAAWRARIAAWLWSKRS